MKYENWSLGYWIGKPFVIFAHWLIHRKIVVTGVEKIPVGKPLVYAGNHQNALNDDLAIVCCLPGQAVWLGRAGLFDLKFTRPLLRFFKIMPVYRIRDGKDSLGKNDEIFEKSVRVLENNRILSIFPEAAHSYKKQMLPHKKGIPRIVFQAEEKHNFNLDIKIVPIGIYFSHYWHIGNKMLLNVGDPISVIDYKSDYEENPPKTILKLREDIYEAIRSQTIEIRSQVFYDEIEQVREIFGKSFLERTGGKDNFLNRFRSDQKLVGILESIEKEQPDKLVPVFTKAGKYQQLLKSLKIRDWLVDIKQLTGLKLAGNIAALLATLPVFLYGTFFNFLPFIFIDRIIRKKVKNIPFWGTFFFVAGLILFPVVYLAEMLLASPLLPGIWLKIGFLFTLPLTGKAAYIWYIGILKSIGRFRLVMLKIFKKPEFLKLFKIKHEIIEELTDLC